MKVIMLVNCLMVLMFSSVAYSLDMVAYKSAGSSSITLSDASVNAAFAANEPTCLKDGPRIIGVNKAFKAKNLKYGDCSLSEGAKKKQALLGYSVNVIRLTELSPAMAKQVMGVK